LIAVSTALFVNPISTICATIGCTGTSSFISFLLFVFSLTTLFTEHSLFGVCTSLLHLVQYLGVASSDIELEFTHDRPSGSQVGRGKDRSRR
jgi:hypothetical protein